MQSVMWDMLSFRLFINRDSAEWKLGRLGVLGIEMESYALYVRRARAGVKAQGILSVSDSIVNGERQCETTERIQTEDGDCIGDSGFVSTTTTIDLSFYG